MFKKNIPTPLVILMLIIVVAAMGTWLLPAGQYDNLSYENNAFVVSASGRQTHLPFTQKTLDSLAIHIPAQKFKNGDIRKPVSIPGTYHRLPQNGQGPIDVFEAPLKGSYDAVEIIFFVLFIGGFLNVFNASGALEKALISLSLSMKGKEKWLIIILTFLFSFAGASYGMAEEGLVFYPVMVPLFLAAGYDLLIPVAVIFAGTNLGTMSSFSNPFSTIIASQVAGVNWSDGLTERILLFVISTAITILYITRYAKKIKANPSLSLVYRVDGPVKSPFAMPDDATVLQTKIDRKTRIMLFIFLFTFLTMIYGVVFLDWWLLQMSALFLTSSILVALFLRMKEKIFVEKFVRGAESLLGVSLIIGTARGVTIILNNGYISDTILYHSARLVTHLSPSVFIISLLILFLIFTLFISSSSGMAVVTMPILGSLALSAGVPGREIVNSYLYGMGIMGFITPTGLILPSLAMVNVSYKAWLKFSYPLMIILFFLCTLFLIIGIKM
ncbi:MAG: YfcC family protein [Bacteroidota bacterium]|nr:YfcC family protein [Bacteroidota bacterium]